MVEGLWSFSLAFQRRAVAEKTERLRALRLAKDAVESKEAAEHAAGKK
jgi:hypothetical protein